MKTYKITIAYDGTTYVGWQYQPNKIAIINVLQNTFKKLFGLDIHLLGSSRTDSGVHAVGQVARFSVDMLIEPHKMLFAWNNILPCDIVIRDLQVINSDFNPRNVIQKIYYYHFFLNRPLPFVSRYGWHITQSLDLEKLRNCLRIFVGTHDFRSFCTGYDKENTIRTIDSIELKYIRQFKCYQIAVKGKGFLRHMVRRIVGASVAIALEKERSIDELIQALNDKDPQQCFFTAPACGLMLRKVIYKNY